MAGDPYYLLYDGDCQICMATARWAKSLDFRNRLRIQPIQASGHLLPGIPRDEVLDAMHIVDPAGRVTTGGESIPTLIEALAGGSPLGDLLRRVPPARGVFRWLYAVLVELRGHLICRVPVGSATSEGLSP